MLTYIIRRLLYSIVVLILASFLVFSFVVKGAGDPLAQLRVTPNVSHETVERIQREKHLNDSIPQRYWYWVQDAFTNQFGTTLLTNKPILPDLWRVMKNTLQLVFVAEFLAILIAIGIGVLLGFPPVLCVRLHGDDVQLPRVSDTGLLAGADAPGRRRADLSTYGAQHLPDHEPELRGPGVGLALLGRPGAPPRAARDRAHGGEHRHVLAIHARLDARGRELRLRPHRPRQGPTGAQGARCATRSGTP